MRGALLGLITSLIVSAFLSVAVSPAAAQTCSKSDIAAIIDATAAKLRELNAAHQPALHSKLQQLAERRGWSEGEREAKTSEFLEDDETRALDEQASQLLVQFETLGDDTGIDQKTCLAKLQELKTVSAQIIEITTAKAAHVTARVDAALGPKSPPRTAAQPEPKTAANIDPRPRPEIHAPPASAPAPRGAEKGVGNRAPPAGRSWETDTVPHSAPGEVARLPAPEWIPELPPRLPQAEELEFTVEDIRTAGRGFFGSISAGLASVIEYAFQTYGRPNGYILGSEGGAALLAGLRYGDGRLVTKLGGEQKVYWQGPSLGYDLGLAGSRVMFLVYNLREPEELFARFIGVDGSAYLVGGVGVTFLKKGRLVLAPIRTGLGLRVGANVGYLKFTPEASLNPF